MPPSKIYSPGVLSSYGFSRVAVSLATRTPGGNNHCSAFSPHFQLGRFFNFLLDYMRNPFLY